MLEQENNQELSSLSHKVAALKGLTMDIEAEVTSQNAYLEDMGGSFDGAGAVLRETMNKLGVLLQTGGSKNMCILASFVVFVFMLLWWCVKR